MRYYRVGNGASLVAIALGTATLASQPAWAQKDAAHDAASDEAASNEIVVTARLRAETLTEAPLSISALTAEQLESRQINSMNDLASMTPGLNFEQAAGPASSRPIIRGQAQLARTAGDVANVGIFIDGVYSPGLTGTEIGFMGIERVEVVRGPQGALYGRNTFAGAINYITKRPSKTLSFGAKGAYGENNLYEVSGYASGPIVGDTLTMRLDAGIASSGGGLVNSVDGKRLDDTDTEMVRASLAYDDGAFSLLLSGTYSHDTTSHSAIIPIPDNSPRRVGKPAPTARSPVQIGRRVSGPIDDYTEDFSFDPRAFGSERTSRRLLLVADYDFGAVTLTSRTGYENRDVKTLVDLDQTPRGTDFTTRPPAVFTQTASGDIEDRYEISQDLRLQASKPGRFDWTIGAYYSHERNLASATKFADPAAGTGGTTAPAPVNGKALIDQQDLNRNTFWSGYASADYDFTDAINLALEGRYTAERKRVRPLQNNYGSDRVTPTNPLPGEQSRTFRYFTPRAILSYKPDRDLNVYLSVAKGTKSGGFNPQATLASEQSYAPESNWTYEVGAKANLLDRKLQVAAAVFQIDWSNQQILTFATGPVSGTDTSITTNIGQSRVRGGELSITYSPTRWFNLNASYAYTDAKYVDATTSSLAGFVDCAALPKVGCPGGVTNGDVNGNRLQFAPKHQGTIGGELKLPVGGDLELYARADLSFNSKKYVDAANAGYIPGRQELRLRLGLQADKIKAQLFCDNVTNDRTPVTAFESRDFVAGNPHYYVRIRQPRQCGMSLSYDY